MLLWTFLNISPDACVQEFLRIVYVQVKVLGLKVCMCSNLPRKAQFFLN